MNPVLPEQDIVADLNALGPGSRLRNARLDLDIDIGKMANRLHLTTDVVEALERDDYSEMTARVFVRGYLHNYAREVNLPVESVLEQFDQVWPESERPMKITEPPRLASDSYSGSRWRTILTWLIVLSGIALFLIWWQGYLDDFLQQRKDTTEQTSDANATPDAQSHTNILPAFMQPEAKADSDADTAETPIAPPIQTDANVTAEPSPSEPVAESANTQPQPIQQPAQPATDAQTRPQAENILQLTINETDDTPAPAGGNEDVVMELRPVAQVEEPAANDEAAATEQSAPQTPVTPAPDAVTVTFNGRCWVDIRDSTRTFKLVGEMNKGDSHQLEGKPPYAMIIGNSSAVQILVGGKPYDLRQHTKGNVARFTLKP